MQNQITWKKIHLFNLYTNNKFLIWSPEQERVNAVILVEKDIKDLLSLL